MNEPTHDRMTWLDADGTTWRVQRVEGRWTLSRYEPLLGGWSRAGSYPSRAAAIRAATPGEGDQR